MNSNPAQADRIKWLAAQRRTKAQSEIDANYKRQLNKQKGDRGRREQHAPVDPREAERIALRTAQEKFKDYIPDVKLEYKDAAGRHLTPKEVSLYLIRHLEKWHIDSMGKNQERIKLKNGC